MFGNMKPSEYTRSYQTFLLPSFPNIFRSRKSSSQSSLKSPRSSISSNASATEAGPSGQRSSFRVSVASNSSSLSSASSSNQTAQTACTPPSSYGSGGFMRPPYQPSFATALTAEPERTATNDCGAYTDTNDFVPQWNEKYQTTAEPQHRLTRAMPDTLRCVRCAADLAFRSQIVSKGFTGRHGRAYLVSAPPTSPDHLFAPEVPASAGKDREIKENNLINIRVGHCEHRQLVTGSHVVADIFCLNCNTKLGWKYVDARDAAQKYKVGKFILEIARISSHHNWEDEDGYDAMAEYTREQDPFKTMSWQKNNLQDNSDNDEGIFPCDSALAPGNALTDPVGAVRMLSAGNKYVNKRMLAPPGAIEPIEFDSDDEDECDEIFAGTWDAEVVAKRRSLKQAALTAV